MKKLLIMVSLILISTFAFSQHTTILGCWVDCTYGINLTHGGANGKVEIIVNGITKIYYLGENGDAYFDVSQPSRTTPVLVTIKWFKRNANNQLVEDFWNNGSNISTVTTGINACSVLALIPLDLKAQRIDANTIKVTFTVAENYSKLIQTYKIKLSLDGVHFVDKAIIFPDGALPNRTYSTIIKL